MRAWSKPLLLQLLLATAPMASAADPADSGAAGDTVPQFGGALLQTTAGLLLIVLLIFALGWLFRRFGKLPLAGKGMVKVVGGVSLGPRERAVILQVDETRLLVGVAPGRVQTLCVLPSPETEADGRFDQELQAEIVREAG